MEYKIIENKVLGFQVQETIDDFGQKAIAVRFFGVKINNEVAVDFSTDFYDFIERHYNTEETKEKLKRSNTDLYYKLFGEPLDLEVDVTAENVYNIILELVVFDNNFWDKIQDDAQNHLDLQ